MTEIYFDNSATTKVSEKAANAAYRAMTENYGNPSSVHRRGAAAFHELNEARGVFAKCLNVSADELYFTSCGTESDNIVVQGAGKSRGKQGRIIVSSVEHPAVYEPAKRLVSQGCDVRFIDVDKNGIIDLDMLESLLTDDTALVSIMHVNNETGAIQPLSEAGKLIRSKAPLALFHVDAVQSFGRLPISVADWQIDALSISGHKIHAPKGIGMLWLRKERNFPPLMFGGGQERGFRSGTENMSGIMAFAVAAGDCYADMPKYYAGMQQVKDTLCQTLQKLVPDCLVNGAVGDKGAAHILNMSFPGIRSEVMLHSLEAKGLFVSAGSACTSKSSKGSRILAAMGLPESQIDSAIRFSFSRYNTVDQARAAADIIAETIDELSLVKQLGKRKRRN